MASNDSLMSIPSGEIIQLNQTRFRKTFLFYLKTNANPRSLFKLMQISPYFCYREFPYLVRRDLDYFHDGWICFYDRNSRTAHQRLDLDNLTKPLWISSSICLNYTNNSNILSHLLSKTAVCDVKQFYIDSQFLKLTEFKFLISSNAVKKATFVQSRIVYDDGSIVPVEGIVKMLPDLKEFYWTFTDDTSEITQTSTAKLIEYLDPSTLTRFELNQIPGTFNFKLFAEFMDQNPLIRFDLNFNNYLSHKYRKTLQTYNDKLIETGEYKSRKVMIAFPKQYLQCSDIMIEHIYSQLSMFKMRY